jgi:hypothetical protein
METIAKGVVYIGEQTFREKKEQFGISYEDRLRHIYVLGKPGMGKTTLLANMARQDAENGHGIAVFDTSGDLISKFLSVIPRLRIKDVELLRSVPDDIKEGKIYLVDLSEGEKRIPSRLFEKLRMRRTSSPLLFYFDEVTLFASDDFLQFLSGARRNGVGVTMAHQHIAQVGEEFFRSLIATIGTLVSFQVGYHDAEILQKIFNPKFVVADFQNLPPHKIYTNLMMNGVNLPLFSAKTRNLPAEKTAGAREEILLRSKELYTEKAQVSSAAEVSEKTLKEILGAK